MTGSDARAAFFAALDALRLSANKGRRPLPVQKIADDTDIAVATLYGWFPAKASQKRTVPRDDEQLLTLVEYLLRKAGVLASQQRLDAGTWQGWVNRRDAAVGATASTTVGVRSFYKAKVREGFAPLDGLLERETELGMLADFCAGSQRYLWIRADPWAGKSALLSTFLLDPPPDVTVIGFFITARAGENNHRVFTDTVLDQLQVLLPEQQETIARETVARDGLRAEMLTAAAEREAAEQRRLVLVVDGLDEYTDTDRMLLTDLLPARPHHNLQVIVSSRYGPEIQVPAHHALATAARYELGKSRFAADIEQSARTELNSLLNGDPAHRDLVALITAAKGLTGSEISELTDLAPFEITPLLSDRVGRSFRTNLVPANLDGTEDSAYVLAHDTLQAVAEDQLGSHLHTARERLHTWADDYRSLGWPARTPDFLLRRYFPMLKSHNDLSRMAVMALDTTRHDRLRARIGGDVIALAEIKDVQQQICDQPDPDLLTTARLARYRDRLTQANNNIPVVMPAIWAKLGRYDRAEALAHTITDPQRRVEALSTVAAVIARADFGRATRIADQAEALARTITEPQQHAKAVSTTLAAIVAIDPERAEALAYTITSARHQAEALGAVAVALAKSDLDRATHIANTAAALAHTITDLQRRAETLSTIAAAVAGFNPDLAVSVADSIVEYSNKQAEALGAVAVVLAKSDLDRAAHIAERAADLVRTFSIPWQQAKAVSAVVAVFAKTDPGRVIRIAERAEAFARTIADPQQQAEALITVAAVIARADFGCASRIANQAEALARTTNDPRQSPKAVSTLAAAITETDPERAEALAYTITDPKEQVRILSGVAAVIVEARPGRAGSIADRAEALARSITDPHQHAEAVSAVVAAGLKMDPEHAHATLVGTITEPKQLVRAATTVVAAIMENDPHLGETFVRTLPRYPIELLQSLAEQFLKGYVSTKVDLDLPDRSYAERVVQRVIYFSPYTRPVRTVIEAIEKTNPDLADHITERSRTVDPGISRTEFEASEARALVIATAQADPDRAEALACTITHPRQQARALSTIALVASESESAHAPSSHTPSRSRRLLARAWLVAGWEIPVEALPSVDSAVLQALMNDLLSESELPIR